MFRLISRPALIRAVRVKIVETDVVSPDACVPGAMNERLCAPESLIWWIPLKVVIQLCKRLGTRRGNLRRASRIPSQTTALLVQKPFKCAQSWTMRGDKGRSSRMCTFDRGCSPRRAADW